MTNTPFSNRTALGKQIINIILITLIGCLLFNLLLFPYTILATLLISKHLAMQYMLDIYEVALFFATGIAVGRLSKIRKVHTTIVTLLTCLAIFSGLVLCNNDKSVIQFINLSVFIRLASIATGSYIGSKINLFELKKKLKSNNIAIGENKESKALVKITVGQQLTNTIITIFVGLLLFCILAIPISFAATYRVSVSIYYYIYSIMMFIAVGIVVGLLSKLNTIINLVLTFFAIVISLSFIGTYNNVVAYIFNLNTLLNLVAIVIGGFVGMKIKLIRERK
jgi:hypothetical protein